MKQEVILTYLNPTASVNLGFDADAISIVNPTSSAILVRRGNSDIPTINNFDYRVPPTTSRVIPAVGQSFGFALQNSSSIIPVALPVEIILSKGEILPSIGNLFDRTIFNVPIANYSTTPQSTVIDVSNANGILIFLTVQNNTGVINSIAENANKVEYSYDGVTYFETKTLNLIAYGMTRLYLDTPFNYLRITLVHLHVGVDVPATLSYSFTDDNFSMQYDKLSVSHTRVINYTGGGSIPSAQAYRGFGKITRMIATMNGLNRFSSFYVQQLVQGGIPIDTFTIPLQNNAMSSPEMLKVDNLPTVYTQQYYDFPFEYSTETAFNLGFNQQRFGVPNGYQLQHTIEFELNY